MSKPVAVEDLIGVVRCILARLAEEKATPLGRDSQPDVLEGISSLGETGDEDSVKEAGLGRMLGSFSTFAEAPLPVELAPAARHLRGFMRLEGTLGAGILEFETGRSLAHVCRGRDRYFAEMASKSASAAREGMYNIGDPSLRNSVSQLKLYGPKQFQLVRVVHGHPHLLLFFSGLVGRADVDAASDLLAGLEGMIAEA